MGFGGLTGLPMATRSGDVPQDLLFYLLRRKLFDDASLEKMLSERSGMLGLSGISGDMRQLQTSKDPRAAAAIDYFVYAMKKDGGRLRVGHGRAGCFRVHSGSRRKFGAGASRRFASSLDGSA